MKWLKRILIGVALLLAIALALPFFIPLDDFIPRIELEASARLKQPVSIKSIRFSALPWPQVTVDGITIGTGGDIRLAKVTVVPDLSSLLQSTRVISRVEIDSLSLTRKAIDRIPALATPDPAKPPKQAPQVRVASIRLNDARVDFGKAVLGPFNARLDLGSDGEPQDASIATQDGKLKILIKPDGSKYLIDVSARAWTLPVGPALVFDELTIKGTATKNDANLGEVNARLYGGTALGKATVSWKKGLQLGGTLDFKQIELQHLAPLLSPGARVSGKLSAKPVFSAAAPSADRLLDALRLETPFSVQNGVLLGVDLQQAATSLLKQGATGGETRFEQLAGNLVMEHGGYHFTQLKITSGALAAEGSVSISPNKELSGRINTQVKAAGASATVPLNVAGTLDAPLLYPTAGTMAGAAAGTVLLGPGFGTSAGAAVGDWAAGLFGKGDGTKPKK